MDKRKRIHRGRKDLSGGQQGGEINLMTTQPELFSIRQERHGTFYESRLAYGAEKTTGLISRPPMPAPATSFDHIVDVNKKVDHTNTQSAEILAFMQAGNPITPLEALSQFACLRLAAIIYDLKKAGYAIKSEMIEVGKKHVARYSL